MKNQSHPIVVVRRKKHKGHGGGAHGSWKIAYADFMTAMMAFFLIMWLISISSPGVPQTESGYPPGISLLLRVSQEFRYRGQGCYAPGELTDR